MFETVSFQVTTGQIVSCAKKGAVLVAIAKVENYVMGKVAMYPQEEMRRLQQMKQEFRKEFDIDPNNEARLEEIKRLKKNYERSQEMFESIKSIGLTDSVDDINKIILHLLLVGEKVTVENRVEHSSNLEGASGQLKVLSTWVILPDSTRYLSSIQFRR
ncbi:hypothetical protein [Iningainema tapete]|uniref:Uncharacterized protein n=1 Tax=Iningainema tapete BLCC-T55 TaxID=2748662 RepID=A0A8J7C7W7_9CYAN|nr:hypothetical protein [Iningainema tapete]MBD2773836.1 hypothetical protein [Iningainema tapete BLCC-T55]